MAKIKLLLFVLIILVISFSIFSFVFYNNNFLIRQWHIPLSPPGFLDTRLIGVAAESYAQGYDPLVENPVNPIGQKLNYPKIWHLLFALGMNQSHTNLIGSIFMILFFIGIGVFWFLNKFDNLTYFVLSVAILSSAVMLGIERANIELVLFFVLSIALLINYHSSTAALWFFLFGAILKLYPAFGFVYLLKEDKKKFWKLFLLAQGIFIVYLLLTFVDTMRVYGTTPKLPGSSFGLNVWWMGLKNRRFFNLPMSESISLLLRIVSYIMVFLIGTVALLVSFRSKNADQFRQGQYLDAFRVGAGIFIGCFIVINSGEHRLVFLVFTIPQIVSWLYVRDRGVSLVPLITLCAMCFSLWNAFLMRFWDIKVIFLLKEFSNWIILTGLLYLFFSSLPNWFSDYFRRPLSRIKSLRINVL